MQFHRFKSAVAVLCALACAGARGDVTTLSVADGSVEQPDELGYYQLPFIVSRSGDASYAVAVSYRTADGTARVVDHDYTPADSFLFLEAGVTATEIPVRVWGGNERVVETFELNLLAVRGFGPLPVFETQQFVTGDDPFDLQAADIDSDGKPDLIVVNRAADTISILLNTTADAANTPSFALPQTIATGDVPTSVAVADLNADGKPDLAVGYQNTAQQISVFLNTTAAQSASVAFGSTQAFATGKIPGDIVATDVNGDGKPDLVTANADSDTISVLLNTTLPLAPTASFAAQQTFATNLRPLLLLAIDVNADGKPDLANISDYGGLSVLRNATATANTASFAAPQNISSYSPDRLAAADMDQDGAMDLIVGTGYSGVDVYLNKTTAGAASASFEGHSTGGDSLLHVAAADLNGDGRPEVAATALESATVSVLPNRTDPDGITYLFEPETTFATGAGLAGILALDLNADDKVDLVTANGGADTVSVLMNALPDTVFSTTYEPTLDVTQAIGTILPYTAPVGGHGGSAASPWMILGLLVFVGLRRLGELRARRR